MAAKFVMLVLAALNLAACTTATTDDVSLQGGGSAENGARLHKPMVRGPIVPDQPAHVNAPAAPHRVARVVPNPLRQTATHTTSAPASVPAHVASTVGPAAPVVATQTPAAPSEPAQPASATEPAPAVTEPPVQTEAATSPPSTIGAYPVQDQLNVQESAPTEPSAPLIPRDLTPSKIEAMFGGMPFLLIAAIAAALVASFGLALWQPNRERARYAEQIEREDHREPYAA